MKDGRYVQVVKAIRDVLEVLFDSGASKWFWKSYIFKLGILAIVSVTIVISDFAIGWKIFMVFVGFLHLLFAIIEIRDRLDENRRAKIPPLRYRYFDKEDEICGLLRSALSVKLGLSPNGQTYTPLAGSKVFHASTGNTNLNIELGGYTQCSELRDHEVPQFVKISLRMEVSDYNQLPRIFYKFAAIVGDAWKISNIEVTPKIQGSANPMLHVTTDENPMIGFKVAKVNVPYDNILDILDRGELMGHKTGIL